MRSLMITAMIVIGMAGSAVAKPSLRDVPEIDNGLFAVGLADQIRKSCPRISPRLLRAVSYLRELQNMALSMGYTEAQITEHIESDVEKNRLRRRGATYMKSLGFSQNEAGYCALGFHEIERNSTVGVLLRADECKRRLLWCVE